MTRAKLTLILLAASLPAWSDVTFTNFGPADSFDAAFGYDVNRFQYVAKDFVATVSGPLETIRLPLGPENSPTADLVITLRVPGPDPNGAVLETWTLSAADVAVTGIRVLTSLLNPFLTAGTTYWLRLESSEAPGSHNWFVNVTGNLGVSASFDQGASWQAFATVPTPALEVNVSPPGRAFQVRYVANLNVVDSLINITNTGANGAMPFGPGIGPQAGNICVNVYAFSPDEQMVGCCSCHITPNGLASLSIYNDIRAITLTGLTPNSMMIKLVATATGGTRTGPLYSGGASSCSQSAAGLNVTHPIAREGFAAWATTGHIPGAFPVPGAPAPFAITETAFTPATLSDQEIASLNNRCTAIIGNGSTFGTCRTCSLGGRGGAKF